ncbi:MAG: hypothetical protein IKD12_00410 [Paludibacteraceae bacterium]|nr:hypothetical protein [Paludibacteraceae bacterium]
MKRILYSMALALCALMLCLPVKATIFNIATELEWEYLIVYHQAQDGMLMKNGDVIRLQHDLNLNYIVGKDHGSVPENWTLTVDLNGHTLRYDGACSATNTLVECKEGSTLNIKDSGDGGQWIFNDLDGSGQIWLLSMSNNSTVNVYGGALLALYNQNMAFSQKAIHCSKNCTVNVFDGLISTIAGNRSDRSLNNKINLYGGTFGNDFLKNANNVAAIWHDPYLGTIKAGKIYGLEGDAALADYKPAGFPESHLDKALAENTKVYIDGVLTPSNQLVSERDAYENKLVEVFYEPDFTINSIAVTSVNASDILGDGKVSFDIASNTLYLKTKEAGKPNTINGNIVYDDFKLNIVVDGIWSMNGRIIGHNGDLIISPAHFALTEEDGDILAIHSQNATAVSLNGKSFCAKNRVRVFIEDNNTNTQTAVSCGMFVINNAWFDAWGKKPIVDCQNSMITNAKITSGSLKDNDVIQVEPNITKYVVWVDVNDKSAGTVTGDGLVNEGVSHTVTATPKSGYHFLRWSNGVTKNPYTFVVTQDTVLYALFEADVVINYYDINVVSADETMGTVSGGGTHLEQGQTVTITATPNEGYQFLYWKNAQNQVVPGSAVLNWTVKADEILTAHFRVAPPADAYNLWVCGTRVTGSNSNDILGDGVWNYDHENRVLTAMNHATYNISNDGFIQDLESSSGPLTVVLDYNIDVTCTTTDNTIRAALMTMKGMTFTGSTFHGLNLNVKDMNAGNMSGDLTITGHIDFTVFLSTPTAWGQSTIGKVFLLSKNLIVNGATVDIGTSEATYKVSDKTNANLQLTNAEINSGAMDQRSLYISDNSPQYEINYLTPSLESLCAVGGFNSYFEGTHITLRAYPATGYKFVSWSDGNTDNPRYMVMPAQNVYLDPIVEVDDSQTPKGAIINASATEGQGTITNFTSGWYAEGTELTITAVPADGYEFVQWSDGETDNPRSITVVDGKNISITAVFKDSSVTTGIDSTTDNPSPVTHKYLRNGLLFIERNGETYNAQGSPVPSKH